MLREIYCDKFKNLDGIRKPIRFHAGLNTVLGSESGSNSIGKSTFLMIIDFVFGGKDYIEKSIDAVLYLNLKKNITWRKKNMKHLKMQ